jgi:hypothetical protein
MSLSVKIFAATASSYRRWHCDRRGCGESVRESVDQCKGSRITDDVFRLVA